MLPVVATLDDLTSRLDDTGIKIDNPFELYKFLRYAWVLAHEEEIKNTKTKPVEQLPYTEVQVGSTKIQIYGLPHGTEQCEPDYSIKKLVEKEISGLGEAEDFLMEENLSDLLITDDGLWRKAFEREMHDHFGGEEPPVMGREVVGGPEISLRSEHVPRAPIKDYSTVSCYFSEDQNRKFDELVAIEIRAMIESLQNPIAFSKRKDLFAYFALPPAVNMILGHLSEKDAGGVDPFNYVDNTGNLKSARALTPYGRSLYMTNLARANATKNDLKTLKLFVGIGHEPDIAYCLKHPEFSLN